METNPTIHPTEMPVLTVDVTVDDKHLRLTPTRRSYDDEPQVFLDMSDGTYLEITHVSHNRRPYNCYYTVKHYCTDEDAIAKKYYATAHAIASFRYAKLDELNTGLQWYLNKIFNTSGCQILTDQNGVEIIHV